MLTHGAQCKLCDQRFPSKELTLEHIENIHNVHKEAESDFGNSSSDEFDGKSDASSETDDESSGVDENEQSSGENSDDDGSNIVSFADSGRKTVTDSTEIQFARTVVNDYADSLKATKLTSEIFKNQSEL
jgi:hypothetical protein